MICTPAPFRTAIMRASSVALLMSFCSCRGGPGATSSRHEVVKAGAAVLQIVMSAPNARPSRREPLTPSSRIHPSRFGPYGRRRTPCCWTSLPQRSICASIVAASF
jgi:hypothetical protein